MAGSSDDVDKARGREIEEGKIESDGTGSDTDTEDARYYLQPHRGPGGTMMISAAAALSPASSFGSDGTVSDAAAVAGAAGFPCHVCRRKFTSWKAVHGHMRVHAPPPPPTKEGRLHLQVAAAGVSTGGASALEEVGDSAPVSMANVVAAAGPRVLDEPITPRQSVGSNNPVVNGGSGGSSPSSVEPSQAGAGAAAPPEQVVPVPVAPTPAAAPPQQEAAAAAPTYIPLMVPASSQQLVPAGVHHPRQAPEGRGFSCRECGRWFPSHQGLGGHVAGHKYRRLAAEAAAAGIDPHLHMACRGGGRPERSHACKICGAEYPSGVSLGGHMRKHYNGKPIVPRKRMRLSPAELALALPLQRAPPAVEAPIAAPPPSPPQLPPGTFRLFGVTIVKQPRNEEEEAEEEHRPVEDQQ